MKARHSDAFIDLELPSGLKLIVGRCAASVLIAGAVVVIALLMVIGGFDVGKTFPILLEILKLAIAL